ncbi:MAG TPA: hypothetical protein VHM31_05815 [Polyangia bacterium]|nr:hypothetical protein [Polyangia bacterium]
MPYTEQRDFTLRIELRREFPENYDGEEDGYAWVDDVQPALAEIVRAAAAILAQRRGFRVHPANRGRAAEEEVTLVAERTG